MRKSKLAKSLMLVLSLTAIIGLTGCSSKVSKEKYDDVVTQNTILSERNDELNSMVKDLKQNVSDLEADNKSTKEELDDLKEKCEPYLELSAAEADAEKAKQELKAEQDRLELEELQAKEAEEQKAKEKKEKAEKEKKEKQGYNTGITFNELARTPDDYKSEKVKFKGKVLQVVEDDEEIQIRLAIDNDYDKVILCGYSPDIVSSRILKDDIITIYAVSLGLTSYKSTLGGNITIPTVWIEKIDQ